MATPALELLIQLGRDTLVRLWDEFAMDDVFGSAKGRRAPTLAEAFVTRYETQLLSVKSIRMEGNARVNRCLVLLCHAL